MITVNENEIRRAVGLLVEPGAVTEVRALDAQTPAGRYPGTVTGYFDDLDSLVQAVRALTCAKGVYVTPNPVDPALLARCKNRLQRADKGASTQDSHIQRRRWLLIDLDPERPSGISSSDAEHEAALQRAREVFAIFRERGWPDPIAADSGNGAHLLYRIDLPTDDQGLVQRCLTALSRRFSDATVRIDEKVFNPARIWKLYGTSSCKGDDTLERPHRMARILSAPDVVVPVSCTQLEALAGELPSVEPPVRHTANDNSCNGHFDVAAFITRHQLDVSEPEEWHGNQGAGTRWVFRKSPLCEHEDGAAYIVQHASGAITAGCHHDHCRWVWKDLRARLEHPATVSTDRKQASATNELLLWEPFPVHVLPDVLRRFTDRAATTIGCDSSFIALPLLAALAGCIGNRRVLRIKRGWDEPAVIWVACIGESGDGKSPAQGAVMTSLWRREIRAIEEYRRALEGYDRLDLLHQAEVADWKRKSSKTGAPPPDKPLKPICARLVCDSVTVEALADRMSQNPNGMLLAADELAGWLGGHNEYKAKKGSDTANWLRMWQAGTVFVDRKTGDKPTLHIPRAAVSIVGGIQPAILRAALGREHFADGLAARLLVAMPPRQARRWTEAEVAQSLQDDLERVLDGLLALEPERTATDEVKPVSLTFERAAKQIWVDWFNRHEDERSGLTGDMAAAAAKLTSYCGRIALVMHLARYAAGEPVDPSFVDARSLTTAVALTNWFSNEVRRVYAALAESDEQREVRQLVDLIRRKGGRVSTRNLQHACRRFRGSSSEAEEALNGLVKAGLGHWETTATATRPKQEFVLNEAVCGNRFAEMQPESSNVEPLPPCEVPDAAPSDDGEWVEV